MHTHALNLVSPPIYSFIFITIFEVVSAVFPKIIQAISNLHFTDLWQTSKNTKMLTYLNLRTAQREGIRDFYLNKDLLAHSKDHLAL
jgi:hypothetical protein